MDLALRSHPPYVLQFPTLSHQHLKYYNVSFLIYFDYACVGIEKEKEREREAEKGSEPEADKSVELDVLHLCKDTVCDCPS
jgi:hypothetical protein